MYRLLLVILLFTFVACGSQRKLQRSFMGKSIEEVMMELGDPSTVFDNEDGKMYIFEKKEDLRGTEISQGQMTLDPIVTPRVHKTERYYVTVKNKVVTSVRLENEYERK